METHDHDHEEHNEEVVETTETVETPEEVLHVEEVHAHEHSGLDGLLEVVFGFEHVVAEFFWNAVFILATFLVTKAVALRKIHKYVDDKHGVKHEKSEY